MNAIVAGTTSGIVGAMVNIVCEVAGHTFPRQRLVESVYRVAAAAADFGVAPLKREVTFSGMVESRLLPVLALMALFAVLAVFTIVPVVYLVA